MSSGIGCGAFFIGICGNIGVGKSVFAELLGGRLGWDVYYEPVAHNPFLEDFYADMSRWAFHLQIYFLAERFKAQKAMTLQKKAFVQDRTVYEDGEIFARVLHERGAMNRRDYECFLALFREMVELLPPPGLLLYLKARPETLLGRIAERGRSCEGGIDVEYLAQLERAYQQWLPSAREMCPVIEIDTEAFAFPPHEETLNGITERIRDAQARAGQACGLPAGGGPDGEEI
jgi:deoxyadenosine/deoxycytidine kinase